MQIIFVTKRHAHKPILIGGTGIHF